MVPYVVIIVHEDEGIAHKPMSTVREKHGVIIIAL